METKPVTVGVDGSEESLLAVEWAAMEAKRHSSPLRIVSAPAMTPRTSRCGLAGAGQRRGGPPGPGPARARAGAGGETGGRGGGGGPGRGPPGRAEAAAAGR